MILTLVDALKVNPKVIQADLDGIETMIRNETNNNFQNTNVRLRENVAFLDDYIVSSDLPIGFREKDTIQVSNSKYNNGLYTIKSIDENKIIVNENFRVSYQSKNAVVTLVEYDTDILTSVTKLLKYDHKMADKLGVKTESISRWSVSYYDLNAAESNNGYPAALMKFLDKYRKMRW